MIQDNIKTRVVGVDINLAKTTCAIVDIRGNIIAIDDFPTSNYPFIGDYVTRMSECIHSLLENNGGYDTVRSVGISAPSGNIRTGSIENSPNMPWKGVVPLGAMLRDRLGLAVALANNAHVMALGEQAFGAAHGMTDFIIISLGDGLGSCIFSNGQTHLGADGFAGEVGHACIVPYGRQCGCGNRGCMETYTAAKGIVLTAEEIMEQSDKPSLMREAQQLTPQTIADMAREGDELAKEVWQRTGRMLGIGMANYVSLFNPEAIIFTGSVARLGHVLLDPASETFESHVFHNVQGKIKFIVSSLEEGERDVLGASVLAWEAKEYSLFK